MADHTTEKTAAEMLRDWLAREERSQRWLAERVGATQTSVSAWAAGHRPPSLGAALDIEEITGIPARAWLMLGDAAKVRQ
jgi:transcriptional regulator with XRE-family HTH domain